MTLAGFGCGPTPHEAAVEEGPGHGSERPPRVVASAGPCYVAYVPGLGNDGATAAQRRGYWRRNANDDYGDFVRWSSREHDPSGCTVLVTGYDGDAAFYSDAAAGEVSRQLNAFITEHAIPRGGLVLVAHSMGGLVTRWILNNGVPGALYYNADGNDFARVVAHTRYAVTMVSPHLGSPLADAVYGSARTFCASVAGGVASLVGQRSDAVDALRRINLEYASASGGWLQDAGRTRTIYTVAGRRWDSGNGMLQDREISAAWWCLGLSACRWNCTETPGDGVVTEASARGRFERDGAWDELAWQQGQWVQGRRVDWLRVDHNHNHARYDDQRLAIRNVRDGVDTTGFPGSYLYAHGFDLE